MRFYGIAVGLVLISDNQRLLNAWLLGLQEVLYAAVDLSCLGKPTKEDSHLEWHCLISPVLFFFHFSGNHIFKGRAAGIAVNENGKGLITGRVGTLESGQSCSGLRLTPPTQSFTGTDWPPAD